MRPGRFFWKLFLGNALLLATLVVASVLLIVSELEQMYLHDLTSRLTAQADALCTVVQARMSRERAGDLETVAREVGSLSPDLRATIIAPDGAVWGDSAADPRQMESHADRPEFREALRTGRGESVRWSHTLGRELKYVARRVGPADAPRGVVRVALPVVGITSHAASTRNLAWKIGGMMLGAALILAMWLAHVWTTPIRRIRETAENLSRGDLSARVQVSGTDELADTARALNEMRDCLADQMRTIDRQRQNLDYLIRTLTEGVMVVNAEGRIDLINPAAVRLLQPGLTNNAAAAADKFVGLSLETCVFSERLRALLCDREGMDGAGGKSAEGSSRTLPREERVQVDGQNGPRHLLARASEIDRFAADGGETTKSRLLVLTDITELTQTIQMKTDFVANASHELRTPLSAIRASVETLQQIDLARDPASAQHFLKMIDRHSERLTELVADLLELSRVESSAAAFPSEPMRLADFLEEVRGRFADAMSAKQLSWRVDGLSDGETARANPTLMRLVMDNLVDNAVKFTEPGGAVSVGVALHRGHARLEVRDTGCGIPAEAQARVFERFYQVEGARSKQGGPAAEARGTGLGLSIVRHAVAAMGGTVRLQSKPGAGTTFTVMIPQSG